MLPVIQGVTGRSLAIYGERLSIIAGNGGSLQCIKIDKSVNTTRQVVSVGDYIVVVVVVVFFFFFVFKQKTAYEISTRYWSSDMCSSDLINYKS